MDIGDDHEYEVEWTATIHGTAMVWAETEEDAADEVKNWSTSELMSDGYPKDDPDDVDVTGVKEK